MTNTDYYTTQSLATAVAAEWEQNFLECESYCEGINLEMQWFLGFNPHAEKWRFPRTPHNEGLMKPIYEIDCLNYGKSYGTFCFFEGDGIKVRCGDCLTMFPISSPIIHRNNKPFPVWDKEGV